MGEINKQQSEKTEIADKNQTDRPWLFKPGQSGNPEGKPVGTKSFSTIFQEAIKKISKEKNIKECEVEVDLVIKAIAEARGGNYKYYQDIFDRKYGKPTQPLSGDPDNPIVFQIINYGNKDNNDTLSIPTKTIPAESPKEPSEVQDSSNAQESGEKQDSPKPTDTEKPA